jgi:hypothetical protein
MIRDPVIIKEMYLSSKSELAKLSDRQELSSYLITTQMLSKALLLSCASFYEHEIVNIVKSLVESRNGNKDVSTWLVRSAVDGQFYKWFNFRSVKNTNTFFSQFGSGFKENLRQILDRNGTRKLAEANFLELCVKRNECVHKNFAVYSLDLTLEEIYQKHKSAMTYIRAVWYGVQKWLTSEASG